MKYGDLIQFEPIESVVQLRDADEATAARLFPSCSLSSPPTTKDFWWLVITALVNPISCR